MNTFSVLYLAFVGIAVIQRVLETFAKRDLKPGKKRMNWSLAAMVGLHILCIMAAVTEFFLMRRGETPWIWLSVFGLCLYVGSVILRNAAIRALGRFWSLHVEIRDEHVLVTDGVYRWIRHPAYLAIWIEVISVPLVGNNYLTAITFGTIYLVFLLYRISVEEQALVEQMGEKYREYQKRTSALLPLRWPRRGVDSK